MAAIEEAYCESDIILTVVVVLAFTFQQVFQIVAVIAASPTKSEHTTINTSCGMLIGN